MDQLIHNGCDTTAYGATAEIQIQFDGSIEELSAKLAQALNLRDLTVEQDEHPPHRKTASSEAMGWEVWLQNLSDNAPNHFRFKMETVLSLEALVENKMHDLSSWLAKLVSTLCDVKAVPGPEKGRGPEKGTGPYKP